MRSFYRHIAILSLALLGITVSYPSETDSDFAFLFNGVNLDGWYASIDREGRKGLQNIFTVTDGMIHAYASHENGSEQRFDRFHRAYSWEKPGWNRLDLIMKGDHAVFKVNGRTVNEAIDMKQWDANTESGYL